MYGQDSWEAAESEFQRQTALKCLEKSGLKESDIRYLFAGDLLGTDRGYFFRRAGFGDTGVRSVRCLLNHGRGNHAGFHDGKRRLCGPCDGSGVKPLCFCGTPVPFSAGIRQSETASTTWTVTGCGSVIVGKDGKESPSAQEEIYAKVTGGYGGKNSGYAVKGFHEHGSGNGNGGSRYDFAEFQGL